MNQLYDEFGESKVTINVHLGTILFNYLFNIIIIIIVIV